MFASHFHKYIFIIKIYVKLYMIECWQNIRADGILLLLLVSEYSLDGLVMFGQRSNTIKISNS